MIAPKARPGNCRICFVSRWTNGGLPVVTPNLLHDIIVKRRRYHFVNVSAPLPVAWLQSAAPLGPTARNLWLQSAACTA